MSQRRQNLEALAGHAWLRKVYARLTKSELEVAKQFIDDHDQLDKGQFELAINRMYLDKPREGHWREILEVLACANSAT